MLHLKALLFVLLVLSHCECYYMTCITFLLAQFMEVGHHGVNGVNALVHVVKDNIKDSELVQDQHLNMEEDHVLVLQKK